MLKGTRDKIESSNEIFPVILCQRRLDNSLVLFEFPQGKQ